MRFLLSENEATRSLTFYVNGTLYHADGSHPNFQAIAEAVRDNDGEAAIEHLNTIATLDEQLRDAAPGFAIEGSQITYAGNPISATLSERISGILRENGNLGPFIKFAERLENNVSRHSREQLFTWIDRHGVEIDPDGYMIAYKGVRPDYGSISSGPGIVNGIRTEGHLSNKVGNIVEIERRYVDDNPNAACSTGLHAGTWEYASTFGHGPTMTVRIDPADVVSVPHDCNAQKIRTSKYVVVGEAAIKWEKTATWDGTQDWDGFYDDYSEQDYDEDFWESEDVTSAEAQFQRQWDKGYNDGSRLAAPLEGQTDTYYEAYEDAVTSRLRGLSSR